MPRHSADIAERRHNEAIDRTDAARDNRKMSSSMAGKIPETLRWPQGDLRFYGRRSALIWRRERQYQSARRARSRAMRGEYFIAQRCGMIA